MTYPNRYKGNCKSCGIYVGAGEGVYFGGAVHCTDTIGARDVEGRYLWVCISTYNKMYDTEFTEVADAAQHFADIESKAVEQAREDLRLQIVNVQLAELAVTANVKSLAQVVAKVTGAERELTDLNFKQASAVREELWKRIHRKRASAERKTYQKSNTCNRCGGAGGADKWAHTGRVCYKCGGSGKYYN